MDPTSFSDSSGYEFEISETPEERMKRLNNENIALKRQVLNLQHDLLESKNDLNRSLRHMQQMASLQKPFSSSFPPEILHMIFERAIPPRFLVDPSACHVINSMWYQSLQQKKTLMNVCRQWHAVAVPFLYEDICITRISQLKPLLATLDNLNNKFRLLVKVFIIHCLVPTWFDGIFVERLKRLSEICPRFNTFSYLSQCKLPSPNSLSALPPNITDLCLSPSVSYEQIRKILAMIAPGLSSLSIHIPAHDGSVAALEKAVNLASLVELSINFSRPFDGPTAVTDFNAFANWTTPKLKRLTFQISASEIVQMIPTNWLVDFLRKNGACLQYFHIHPGGERVGDDDQFYTHHQEMLNACPVLEHLVLHAYGYGSLTHKRVKWIDIWTLDYESREPRPSISRSMFPMVESVRYLYSVFRLDRDVPLIFPPNTVTSSSGDLCYSFPNLELRVSADGISSESLWDLRWTSAGGGPSISSYSSGEENESGDDSESNGSSNECDSDAGDSYLERSSDEYKQYHESSDTESDIMSVESEEIPIDENWDAVMDLLD